ncbi:MAG: substrate-binding domain-containing protein [Gammaproteobacteria bacterium]
MHISFSTHWIFDNGKAEEFNPVVFRLLRAIRSDGSLKSAAQREGLSYRHAWGLIKKWESEFRTPLVKLQRGRGHGAQLTSLGEKLIWAEQYLDEHIGPGLGSIATELNDTLAEFIQPGRHGRIRIHASHGMAIIHLRDLLRKNLHFDLDFQICGSLESLRRLANNQCHIAGFHFPEQLLNEAVAPLYSRWLSPDRHSLVLVARRQQGIMHQRGNPKNISGLADLQKRSVRFINRQRDSGTRTIFDQLLKQAGIDPGQLHGYTNEEFTHIAVAAMIASGAADAGFGIMAAASQFGLDFIPVLEEAYLLALDNGLSSVLVKEIKKLLRSDQFRIEINKLDGYDASQSGQELAFPHLFGDNNR